jgi:hypothetical protein
MSMAYGDFYQKPENTQLMYTNQLGYTKATHYIIRLHESNYAANFSYRSLL